MRSLIYFVAMTLDGYIAGTDRGDPGFFPFEGPHVTNLLAEFPEMIPGHLRAPLGLDGDNQRFCESLGAVLGDRCQGSASGWFLGMTHNGSGAHSGCLGDELSVEVPAST